MAKFPQPSLTHKLTSVRHREIKHYSKLISEIKALGATLNL